MRILIVMNPRAGRGRRGRTPDAVAAAFRSRDLSHELVPTTAPDHARRIVAEVGARFDAVVVVGGDGSLHEVLQSLDLERHVLGIVPWGTGNDLAWMQGWPRELDACVERIAEGRERRVDLGWWSGTKQEGVVEGRFHTNVGLGFLATVNAMSHRIGWVRGAAVYILALLGSLPHLRSYPVSVEWDDGEFEGTSVMVAVGNAKRVGGAFLLTPRARQDDGLLDLVFPRTSNLIRLLALLPRVVRGTHIDSSAIVGVQTTRIRVRAPQGIPAYVDGEFVGHDLREAEFRTLPGALRMF